MVLWIHTHSHKYTNVMKMRDYQVCDLSLPPPLPTTTSTPSHLSNQTINSVALFVCIHSISDSRSLLKLVGGWQSQTKLFQWIVKSKYQINWLYQCSRVHLKIKNMPSQTCGCSQFRLHEKEFSVHDGHWDSIDCLLKCFSKKIT